MSTKLHIKLDKITFRGKHGLSDLERSNLQPITISLLIEPKSKESLLSDDINKTINYLDVYEKIQKNVEDKSFRLLESLGNAIIKDIIECWNIRKIQLSIRKPNIKIDDNKDFIEVSLKKKI